MTEEQERRGRPPHFAPAHSFVETSELTILDKFLSIPSFGKTTLIKYTKEDAIAATMGYSLTGSLKKASQIAGVPYLTVKEWRKAAWWDDCCYVARELISDKLEDKFTSILNESMNQLAHRLERGNVHVRNGKTIRVPINAEVLARIIQILFDKRQLLRGDVTSRSETKSVESRLDDIKKAAEDFIKGQDTAQN